MRHHVPLVPLAPRPAPPLGFFPTLVWGFVIFTVSGLFYGVWIALAAVSEWTGFSFIYAPMECALNSRGHKAEKRIAARPVSLHRSSPP